MCEIGGERGWGGGEIFITFFVKDFVPPFYLSCHHRPLLLFPCSVRLSFSLSGALSLSLSLSLSLKTTKPLNLFSRPFSPPSDLPCLKHPSHTLTTNIPLHPLKIALEKTLYHQIIVHQTKQFFRWPFPLVEALGAYRP